MMLKNKIFWYLIIPQLIFITLIVSLSPWIFEWLATPVNQVFSGINRWSNDYFTYLGYVEIGRRGQLAALLLPTTVGQFAVYAHLAHTLPGYIFGHLLGLSSVISYHLARGIYGLVFLVITVYFFYSVSKSKIITILAFIFTFYVSGFPKIDSLKPFHFSRYVDWMAEQNIIGRPTIPLHYSTSVIFFIIAFIIFFVIKTSRVKRILLFGLSLNLILLANPFAYLIAGFSFGLYVIISFLTSKNKRLFIFNDFVTIFFGFFLSLPIFFYNSYFLSLPPWGPLGNAPKYFVVSHMPIPVFDTLMAVGPTLLLAIFGIIFIIFNKQKTNLTKKQIVFQICWLSVQFFLLFFGDNFKIDSLRSFFGLYYLPLGLFSAYFVVYLVTQIKKVVKIKQTILYLIIMIIIFLPTLPNYLLSYKDQLFGFTDFKSFQLLAYPTQKQVASFSFLEKNTPIGSGVMAMFEASSLIPGFSGNATTLNMDNKIKELFYSNQLPTDKALQFLKTNNIKYVYNGYQEKWISGNIWKYPFLKKIYKQDNIDIFRVL